MSAQVTLNNASRTRVFVEAGNAYDIDHNGFLHLNTSYYGGRVATFRPNEWSYVVVSPNRGPDGRFKKKGS